MGSGGVIGDEGVGVEGDWEDGRMGEEWMRKGGERSGWVLVVVR